MRWYKIPGYSNILDDMYVYANGYSDAIRQSWLGQHCTLDELPRNINVLEILPISSSVLTLATDEKKEGYDNNHRSCEAARKD